MAESNKVTANDVIQKDIFKESTKSAEKFLDIVLKTEDALIALNKETSKQLAKTKKGESSAEIKAQNDLLDKSAKQRKLLAETQKLEAEATSAVIKAKVAEANQEKKTNAEKAKAAKTIEQENSLYFKQSKRLNDLRKEYKELALAGKGSDKATKDLKTSITALDKELKDLDAEVGQFNRNVGDYKNQMSEAINETGVFSKGLGKLDEQTAATLVGFGGIVKQLQLLTKAQEAGATGAKKLSNALKIGGIGLLLAGVAALAAYFNSSREAGLKFDIMMNKIKATANILFASIAQIGEGILMFGKAFKQALSGDFSDAADSVAKGNELIKTSFKGNVDAISKQIYLYDQVTRKVFEYEDELRRLQITLAQINMDEEDYNEIQADNTISLQKQKDALEQAIKLRKASALVSKQIADTEFDIASAQLEIKLRDNKVSEAEIENIKEKGAQSIFYSKIAIKVGTDELQVLHEKYLAQLAASDALDDLDRQEATRRRDLLQKEVIDNIELIRSKKLGADAEVKILTKQIADESYQLEEREKLNAQLRQKQLDALDVELSEFERVGLSKEKVLDLINTKDAVALAKKLELIGLDEQSAQITDELAKVVFEAQTQELENYDRITKFEEEKIKRLQKIEQINKEIQIINENTLLNTLNEEAQNKAKANQDANVKLFQNQNVFNNKLISESQRLSDERIIIAKEESRIKEDLLSKQYEIDKTNIISSVSDEKIRLKELEKLATTYNQNLVKLATERTKSIDELNNEIAETQRQLLIKQTDVVVDYINKSSQALADGLEKRYNNQSEQQQRQIDKTNANISKQQDLAQRGQANQLAFEEAKLAQQQLAAQDAAKKQAKIQEQIQTAQALLNAYNSELNQPGANPATAGSKAIADVLLFKGLAKGIVQFAADGNDDVQGPGTTKSDSIPFMLSKHEGVVKADANMGNKGVVKSLNDGTFNDMYMPKLDISKGDTGTNISNSLLLQSNKEVIELLTEIKNKPTQFVDVDKLGNLIETVYTNGVKTVTLHKNSRSRI